MSDTKVTPTEDLIMEVLSARLRLGETLWTFDSRHKIALKSLERKGLVNVQSGVVEKTLRASMTNQGIKEYFAWDYRPPLYREIHEAIRGKNDYDNAGHLAETIRGILKRASKV